MHKQKGFTLIELLVVISIIAILMAILLPVLGRARDQAKLNACLANLKNLSTAWFLYTLDNDGLLVGSDTEGEPPLGTPYDWVYRPTSRGDLIKNKKEGIKKGKLFPYVKSIDVYHCPADRRIKNPPGYNAFRSYSIPTSYNSTLYKDEVKVVKKYNQIRAPTSKYVFVEEPDPRGWNVGPWGEPFSMEEWWDPVAVWHYKKGTLGFADGHAEPHKWVDKRTIELGQMAERNTEWSELVAKMKQPDNEDLIYMFKHMCDPASRKE